MFEGCEVALKYSSAGRTELPDNLIALLCLVAMMVLDYATEITLFLLGSQMPRFLPTSLSPHSSTPLSSLPHRYAIKQQLCGNFIFYAL